MGRTSLLVSLVVLFALIPNVVVGAEPAPAPAPANSVKTLRIGVPESLFSGVPTGVVKTAAQPFQKMFEKELGLTGEIIVAKDFAEITDLLRGGKLDVAIYHGIEYGWVKHHPELVPLMVSVPKYTLRACIVVNADSKADGPQKLKGECLAVPNGTKAYCALYIDRLRTTLPEGCCCPAKLEGRSVEDALDAVAAGTCPAALVDESALTSYRSLKPGVGARLKVLAQSEPFPSALVVYRKDAFDEATAKKTRDGLLKGMKTPEGQLLTGVWKLKGFDDLNPAYLADLEKCLKAYPAPK